jgi:hypothetical protein
MKRGSNMELLQGVMRNEFTWMRLYEFPLAPSSLPSVLCWPHSFLAHFQRGWGTLTLLVLWNAKDINWEGKEQSQGQKTGHTHTHTHTHTHREQSVTRQGRAVFYAWPWWELCEYLSAGHGRWVKAEPGSRFLYCALKSLNSAVLPSVATWCFRFRVWKLADLVNPEFKTRNRTRSSRFRLHWFPSRTRIHWGQQRWMAHCRMKQNETESYRRQTCLFQKGNA